MTLYESNSLILQSDFNEMRLRFQDALRDSYNDLITSIKTPEPVDALKHEDAFEYIGKMMTSFMLNDNMVSPEGIEGVGSISERIGTIPHRSKLIADFGLFVSGMFPEYLLKKQLKGLYEDWGVFFYKRLHEKTHFPTYDKLAWKFDFYQSVITNMRDMYSENEATVTTYGNQRWRAIFDGTAWEYQIENASPIIESEISRPWREN